MMKMVIDAWNYAWREWVLNIFLAGLLQRFQRSYKNNKWKRDIFVPKDLSWNRFHHEWTTVLSCERKYDNEMCFFGVAGCVDSEIEYELYVFNNAFYALFALFRMCARAVLRFLFYFPMINGWVRHRPHKFQFNSIERTEWEEFHNNFTCLRWSTLCVHPINCRTFYSISDRKIVLLQWNGDFTEWNSIRCDTMQPVEITNSHRTKLSRRSIIITCSIYIHLKNGTWSEATNNMSN